MTANIPGGPTSLDISPDLDLDPWADLADLWAANGRLARIGLLSHGATGGQASVALAIRLDDGTRVCAETTWRLLHAAVRALAAGPVGSEETP